MKRLFEVIGVIAFVISFSCTSSALEVKGRIIIQFDRIYLIEKDGGNHAVVQAKDDVKVKNLRRIWDIRKGDYINVKYSKEVAGVKLADEIIAKPVVELFDTSLNISIDKISKLIKSDKKYVLIDSRPADLYNSGHIPTALSVPYKEFNPENLPEEKDRLIVFYSRSLRDPAANESAKKAVSYGYTNIKVCSEGFKAWIGAYNYAVVELPYVKKMIEEGRPLVLVDIRSPEKVKSGYIPGAFNIQVDEMKLNRIQPRKPGDPIVFYGEDDLDARAHDAAVKALEVVTVVSSPVPVSVLKGGFRAWKSAGFNTAKGNIKNTVEYRSKPSLDIIEMDDFKKIWEEEKEGKDTGKLILDVRKGRMWHMKDFTFVKNIPIMQLPFRIEEIPRDKEIIIFCTSGIRAEIAYHILRDNGFRAKYILRNVKVSIDGTIQ